MRRFLLLTLLLFPTICQAQGYGYGGGAYSIERSDEDYSYLKDPSERSDPFDPIKYIPLGGNPDDYLSLGGQVRNRFDYFNENEFGAGPRDDGFDLTRMLANADLHLGPDFRAFVQLDSSLEYQRAGGPRPGDAQDIDFQQGFVDLTLPFNPSTSMVVRVGRQELIYGAQRLISPNDWRNTRLSFDGAKVSLYLPNDTLDVFATRPVVVNKTRLDSDDDNTYFYGLYNVTELPKVLPGANSKLDLYLLDLDQYKSAEYAESAETYTLGTRFHTTPGNWDFDVEPDWQFGRNDSRAIEAYSIATEGGYTFASCPMTPRTSLGFDLSSGDPNPARRFNQLFPPQYIYLGHMYLFGRENLIDLHPGVTLNPLKNVTITADEHIFWRQNTNDAVYNLLGEVVQASDGSHSAYMGNEADFAINWQIDRHLSMYAGYAHFFTGTFFEETGPHQDEDFGYAAVTFTF